MFGTREPGADCGATKHIAQLLNYNVLYIQELMFCENCSLVFCLSCAGGSHCTEGGGRNNNQQSSDHTVLPLATASKRLTEIIMYKANECSGQVRDMQEYLIKCGNSS